MVVRKYRIEQLLFTLRKRFMTLTLSVITDSVIVDCLFSIACLLVQVEQQGSQLEMSQERNMLLQEDNKVLKEKTRDLEL